MNGLSKWKCVIEKRLRDVHENNLPDPWGKGEKVEGPLTIALIRR